MSEKDWYTPEPHEIRRDVARRLKLLQLCFDTTGWGAQNLVIPIPPGRDLLEALALLQHDMDYVIRMLEEG